MSEQASRQRVRPGDERPVTRRGVSVLAPVLTLEVAIERDAAGGRMVHFHPAGQGFWVARMAAGIGAGVTLCAPLGGEPGRVLRGLVEAEGIRLVAIELETWNGVWLSDGPAGERATILETPIVPLVRHEVDDLYGAALTTGLRTGVSVLTGSAAQVIDPDVYGRLARDLAANGAFTICDLSGDDLRAALTGGVGLVKVADDELVTGGWAASDSWRDVLEGAALLREQGAGAVVVSRAGAADVLAFDDEVLQIDGPRFAAKNHRGAGDTMTAALAAAIARGDGLRDAARLASAAGALNVTRSGLGTGDRAAIDRLVDRVRVADAREDGLPPEDSGTRDGKKPRKEGELWTSNSR